MALGIRRLIACSPVVPSLERDGIFGVVEVFVRFDHPFVLFIQQDGLSDDDVGIREVDLQVALLGDGHAAHDDVELLGDQGRDDAVPGGVDRHELDPHGFGHLFGHIDVESDEISLFVGHFKWQVTGFETDPQLPALDDVIYRRFSCEIDVIGECSGRRNERQCQQCSQSSQ